MSSARRERSGGVADDVTRGRELLHELAAGLGDDRPVEFGRMFNGEGIKVTGSFFAFIGHTGQLIAKLPAERVRHLVESGDAEWVTMGTRTMREWADFPVRPDEEATKTLWRSVLVEAYTFVASLSR